MALDLRLSRKDSFKHPLVSIVVPLFNEERFVADCLNSIKRQTYKNWECIVVNDCSTDRSVEVAKKTIGDDQRFRILHREKNSGLSRSRNTGLRSANGEFITFLDSDDFLFSSAIWQRVYTLESNNEPQVAGAFCAIVQTKEENGLHAFHIQRYLPARQRRLGFLNMKGECPFNAHAPLLKASLVQAFSGFNEKMLHGAEDWDLWSRMMRHGYVFVSSYGYGAGYRQKHESMVRRLHRQHVNEAKRLLDSAYEPFVGKPEIEDAPHVFLHPVHYYEKSVQEAKRFIGYAFMAYLAGDKESASEILSLLDPEIGFLVEERINVDGILSSALRRYYCLGPSADKKTVGPYQHRKNAFENLVMARFQNTGDTALASLK